MKVHVGVHAKKYKHWQIFIVLFLSIIKLLLWMGRVFHLKKDQTLFLFIIGKGTPLSKEFLKIITATLASLDETMLVLFSLSSSIGCIYVGGQLGS